MDFLWRSQIFNIFIDIIFYLTTIKDEDFRNMIYYYFNFCHVKFNPPIPIRAWEVNLSENWLKGICDHAPDDDHMGSELLKMFQSFLRMFQVLKMFQLQQYVSVAAVPVAAVCSSDSSFFKQNNF